MRHIGFPLYVGSFDFYCFMVSLMCDKSFYYGLYNDPKLHRLWSMMWLSEDLERIENDIKKVHDETYTKSDNNRIVDIIRGAWLRCDIIPFIWNLIKME